MSDGLTKPNTREKLIELIGSVKYGNRSLIGNNFQRGFIEKIADHLIANGVTIPVRCKDCKYINREIHAKGYGCLCDAHSSARKGHERFLYVEDDDFCSLGERRNDENTG